MRGRMGRPGLVGTAARTAVIAGTATAVSGRVARRQMGQAQAAQAQAEQQQQYAAAQAAAAPAPTPPPPPQQMAEPVAPAAPAMSTEDMIAALEKLGQLHAQGILTDEEFAAQKAKLLG